MNFHFVGLDNHQQTSIQLDRGYLFGDGFFTTGIIRDGALEHQTLHQVRLTQAANKFRFTDFDVNGLFAFIEQKIRMVKQACIRISVSRAQVERGYSFQGDEACNICIQLSNLTDAPIKPCELSFAKTPITINPFLAGIKHLNRLDNVFAAKELVKANQECLMCNDDLVICGSRSNLFIFSDSTWHTPKLDKAGIEGITRLRLIKLMQAHNINMQIRDISKQDVSQCEAAFVTNSLLGIWPASKIEDKALATQMTENLKCLLDFSR